MKTRILIALSVLSVCASAHDWAKANVDKSPRHREWVKLKNGCSVSEDDVRDFCRGKVQDYNVPRRVKFVTEFPTTVTGKVQKYRMREISAGELGSSGPSLAR